VTNTTRLPDLIGGVWVATFTPATSTSAWLRLRTMSGARVTRNAARNGS